MSKTGTPLLRVDKLSKHYPIRSNVLRRTIGKHAVLDQISFEVYPGETVAVVGGKESGKTTLVRLIMQLEKQTDGRVYFQNHDLTTMKRPQQKALRQQMQVIFEDPYQVLNPRLTIGEVVAEPFTIHRLASGKQRSLLVKELLTLVGINSYMSRRFPYEFSGGMRQRVNLARALATKPQLLIADDPFAGLDPVLQRPFVTLFKQLKAELDLSLLFFTTHLNLGAQLADRIGVMYAGEMVELADTQTIFSKPAHPYTQYLLSQIPLENPEREEKREPIQLKGQKVDPKNWPPACRFHPRCPYTTEICKTEKPRLRQVDSVPHEVACHHAERFLD